LTISQVTEMCEMARVYLLYLPPYSPHLNPIEQSFHLLKQWLRRWRDLAPKQSEFTVLGEEYKLAWKAHLEEASYAALEGVDIRGLFRQARIPC
jgi:hypothetical protein